MQQDGLSTFVFDEIKDEPQIVNGTTGPRTRQFPFQLVRFQSSLKGILRKRCKRGFEN